MTYRARHARPAPPVSPQVRAGSIAARWAGLRTAVLLTGSTRSDVMAQQSPRATLDRQGSTRLERIGTPLLLIGAGALALALIRFGLRLAEPAFLARMFDLDIYRDAGLIVRHAYHFGAGQPPQLYDWVAPHGINPFTYPPFAVASFAAMSFLSPLVLAWGLTAASFAALVTVIWMTLASIGVPAGRARTGCLLTALAVALWTQPVQSNFGRGQINLLLMAAIIWDLRPAITRQTGRAGTGTQGHGAGRWWTGIATGVAAGIKLTPLIFIPYLLMTRRFRQAAVAAAAFAATVGIGFAVVPGASVSYWQSTLLDRTISTSRGHREFFFASAWNQSLRGYLGRLLQHDQLAVVPWVTAAALTVVTGLLCAAWLHRDGYPMLGLLTCALTGLLVSPISWLHQWVWVAPWLVALGGMALLAPAISRRIWLLVAGLITLAFVNWPSLPVLTGAKHGMNVVTNVPMRQPLSWQGDQVIAGNIYFIAGAAGLLALLGWGIARVFPVERAIARTQSTALRVIQKASRQSGGN
jgi:alpha-1,2-mannosyltransferase